jgi:hypothetical protein
MNNSNITSRTASDIYIIVNTYPRHIPAFAKKIKLAGKGKQKLIQN